MEVSESTVSRNIARLPGEWPLKKVEGSPRARRGSWGPMEWFLARFDVRRPVFVDESGFRVAMDRLRARAPRGERAYGKVPRNRGKNLTLTASMSLSGMGDTMAVEGSTDALAFEVYVEHFLAPSLKDEQVVVLDDLGAHKPRRVRELTEARGAQVLFLPSHSPDLNPIEEAFSKIEAIVRKAQGRALGKHYSKR